MKMTEEAPAAPKPETRQPGIGKKLYLAGLGGSVVLREGGSRLFAYLVARGEGIEEPTRQRAKALHAKAREELRQTGEAIGRSAQKVFERFPGPVRNDLSELSSQVDRLGSRIEKLET